MSEPADGFRRELRSAVLVGVITGFVTLSVATIAAAYGEVVERRLAVEDDRRDAYSAFLGEVERCSRTDPATVAELQKVIAPLQDSEVANAVADPRRLVDLLIGDPSSCQAALSVSRAKLFLLAPPAVSDAADALSFEASTFNAVASAERAMAATSLADPSHPQTEDGPLKEMVDKGEVALLEARARFHVLAANDVQHRTSFFRSPAWLAILLATEGFLVVLLIGFGFGLRRLHRRRREIQSLSGRLPPLVRQVEALQTELEEMEAGGEATEEDRRTLRLRTAALEKEVSDISKAVQRE